MILRGRTIHAWCSNVVAFTRAEGYEGFAPGNRFPESRYPCPGLTTDRRDIIDLYGHVDVLADKSRASERKLAREARAHELPLNGQRS